MLALKDLLSGGKKADTMDAGSAKPTRRKSMACLRMIPRNIVARKRSVFLDHHPVLTDWQEPREDAPDSGTSPGTPSPKSKTRGGEGHQSAGEGEGKGEGDTLPEDNGRCAKAAALEGPREVISVGGVSGASPSIPTSISTAAASSSTAAAATSSSCSTSANTPTRRRIRGSETCSQDGRTQQVIPLQHGDSLNISDNQSFCQIERALQRSPGDGDEAPRVVTSDDKRENDEKAAMTSQGMRAVATAEAIAASGGRQTAVPPQGSARQLTSWASGHRHAGHAAETQEECTCKPHPTGIGGGGAVGGGGGARGGPHGGSFRAPPQPPAHHRGPHSPVLPPKKSSQAAGGRRISLPEGPSQPPFFLQRDSSGLTCTCPQSTSSSAKRRSLRDTLTLPRLALASEAASNQDDGRSSSSSLHDYPRYRRSISLGQILQHSDGPYNDGFNSAGSTYPGSSETSPDTHTDATGRELSDFEKENLLFLKDLDNSYHRPLTQSLSNTSLGSTFSEDSLTGDSTPRGGSPYPGRREFPRTAYSPSKTSASKIIRSVSREEPEDDLSEGEASRDGRRRPEATGRKISLPILAYRGSTSDSSAPSSVSSLQGAPAWWNSRQVREPPPRKFSLNHTSPSPSSSFAQAKMVFTGRSLSSPSEPPSRIPMATHSNGGFLQEPPWRSPRGLGCASSTVPNASGQGE
ncbi:uncharacterized protein LOC119595549 [Penaeus monodon]|uniref:uncharacterized protein LOC119595549 n=1 Tax=Penaeus monodon TaxID=6687 RepID=UPI0018A7B2EE|nr:uncharacterized protein LOC119595549 [Penaeus monodon]